MKMKYWYAGYWIKNCESMSYKSRFGPAESLGTDGLWRPFEDSTPETRQPNPAP